MHLGVWKGKKHSKDVGIGSMSDVERARGRLTRHILFKLYIYNPIFLD